MGFFCGGLGVCFLVCLFVCCCCLFGFVFVCFLFVFLFCFFWGGFLSGGYNYEIDADQYWFWLKQILRFG